MTTRTRLNVPNQNSAGVYYAVPRDEDDIWPDVVWSDGGDESVVGEFTWPDGPVYFDGCYLIRLPQGWVCLDEQSSQRDHTWHLKNICGDAVHTLMHFLEVFDTPSLKKDIERAKSLLDLADETMMGWL